MNKSEAYSPPVKNKPYVEDETWSWSWKVDGDRIVEALGWSGLAAACAYVKKEDGKLPEKKENYFLPHHKLQDGKLVLSVAGVRAAWQRLQQLKSRLKDKEVETEINISEAESHLEGHRDFLEKELKDKSQASFVDYVYIEDPSRVLQANPNLTDEEKRTIFYSAIEELLRRANWDLYLDYYTDDDDGEVFNYLYKVDLVCESLKGKINELVNLLIKDTNNSVGGKNQVNEEIKKLLAGLKKEEAEEFIKQVVAMHNVSLKDIDVEEKYKEQVASLQKELDETKKSLSDLQDKYEVLEKTHKEYVEKVEAEKREAEKDAIAQKRMKELKDNGIDFSEERQKSVFAKLREMSDEQYSEYKEELLEVKASVNSPGSPSTDDGSDDDMDNVRDLSSYRRKMAAAAFNVEYAKNKSIYDEYAELAEEM